MAPPPEKVAKKPRPTIPYDPTDGYNYYVGAALAAARKCDLGYPSDRILGRHFVKPIIYVWMRGLVCLYVGESGRGLSRIYAGHHAIKALEPDDTILVWDAPAEGWRRRALEGRLIFELQPTLNRAGALRRLDEEPAP